MIKLDNGSCIIVYNVTDAETGEDDMIVYYPPNGLEVPLIGSFTVVQ